MTKLEVCGLLGTSLMIAAGQALFKSAALAIPKQSDTGLRLLTLLQIPSFWLALLIYGSATLLWIVLLQSIPLSRAYPFAALGFLIVPALAAIFFGEKLDAAYLIGASFIAIGIVITSRA